jgi:uncharacterized membrane protein
MEQFLHQVAGVVAEVVECIAVLLIAYGAGEAFLNSLQHLFHHTQEAGWRTALFSRFGVWLLLGLQFALAADIVRSVIAPSWNDIGHLAAIAAIRTFLSYFLERDLETEGAPYKREGAA